MTKIVCTKEFKHDMKKLQKKYPSLPDDMVCFTKALSFIRENKIPETMPVAGLGKEYQKYHIYKVKSFRCQSLRGKGCRSGIRVIFFYDVAADEIVLIEMYSKSTTENHDNERIKKYLDSIS